MIRRSLSNLQTAKPRRDSSRARSAYLAGVSRIALFVSLGMSLAVAWAGPGAAQSEQSGNSSLSPSVSPGSFASPFGLAFNNISPTGTALEESVQRRGRPEYEPLGIQVDDALTQVGQLLTGRKEYPERPRYETAGSMQLYPKIEGTMELDDNLYRRQTNKVSDTIFKVAPSLLLQSDWANHAFYVSTGAVSAKHVNTPEENYINYNIGTGGRLDIVEDEFINANLRFAQEHEQRGTPEDLGLTQPTAYKNYHGDVFYTRRGSTVYSRLKFNFDRLDYDDNGTTNNDDRDRNEYETSLRLGWEDVPGMVYYIEPSLNWREYDNQFDDSGQQRSSNGWRLLAGINWDVSGVTYAETGIGYMSQNYDDPSLPTISGWSFNGKVVWNTTELVTLTLDGSRSIEETTQTNASGILATRAAFTIDYEAWYNIILDTRLSWRMEEYEGNNREDDLWGLSFGGRYLISENYYSSLRFSHDVRESSAAGSGYTDNRFVLTIGAQL